MTDSPEPRDPFAIFGTRGGGTAPEPPDETTSADQTAAAPESNVTDSRIDKAIATAVNRLPSRDRQIIEMRWGLAGEAPRTIQQASDKLGHSREHIRAIEAKVMEALREDPELRALAESLPEQP